MRFWQKHKLNLMTIATLWALAVAAIFAVPKAVQYLESKEPVVHASSLGWFGGQVSCGTAATNMGTALSFTAGQKNARAMTVSIDSASANTVYFGPSTVTNVPANARGRVIAATSPNFNFGLGGAGNGSAIDPTDVYCASTTGATTVYLDGHE